MAQIKISELNSVSDVNNNDVLPIINGGDTKKVSVAQLAEKIGGGDLSNYLAKDNTNVFVPVGDYNPSTKKYVDDSIADIPTPDLSNYYTKGEVDRFTMPIIDASPTSASSWMPTAIEKQQAEKIVNYCYTNGIKYTPICLRGSGVLGGIVYPYNSTPLNSQQTFYIFYNMRATTNNGGISTGYDFRINGTWDGNVFTCTNLSFSTGKDYYLSNFLTTNSAQTISAKKTFSTLPESSVVPTTDNQLANKKYVDDAIASAITTTLGGSY